MLVNTVKMSGVVALAGLLLASPASAFNFGDMMNPSKWMGGDDDDDLIGGRGADGLVGGAGADSFIFTAIADSRAQFTCSVGRLGRPGSGLLVISLLIE